MNEYLSLILTIATIVIPVFATIYTGYIRIKNENREEHKPYLVLGPIEKLFHLDRFSYFFIVRGQRYKDKTEEEILKLSQRDSHLQISLDLKNIGYGVASNIKLYNLSTAQPILGVQESSENINQKRFTTFDIPKDMEKKVQMCIFVDEEEGMVVPEQHCILCVYQDLNQNIYDFIIGIDVKKEGTYDFFAYQRSSHSYARLVSAKKKMYQKIMKKYKK